MNDERQALLRRLSAEMATMPITSEKTAGVLRGLLADLVHAADMFPADDPDGAHVRRVANSLRTNLIEYDRRNDA